MLKRFYSKRSGFTLVEIIVAFAVFAIMASMIAQILSLSVSARNYNTQYARELAKQEKLLTVIEKRMDNYNATDKTGDYSITFTDGGTPLTMGYQIKATDPSADQGEGINYFLSPVDYQSKGTTEPITSDDSGGADGMSQADRMDTRITGTAGIGNITIYQMIKDEFDYTADDKIGPDGKVIDVLDNNKFIVPEGHTRYFIEVSATSVDDADNQTIQEEDLPYSQYKLFFYSDELDSARSAVVYDKENDGGYTQEVYKKAVIVDSGHIDTVLDGDVGVVKKGLTKSNTSSGTTTDTKNYYMVQSVGNCVRIGTDYTTTAEGASVGEKFQGGKFTRFYVEFVGDPHLDRERFGHNVSHDEFGNPVFTACPLYKDEYDSNGVPTYEKESEEEFHSGIYGAYYYTRNYKKDSTPETPEDTE